MRAFKSLKIQMFAIVVG